MFVKKKNPERMVLSIKEVSKSFGKFKAVVDLNLEIEEGEIYALIGPNGAGKTTTIKMICGLMSITSGAIEIEGYDVVNSPIKAKSKLGYIPDNPFVYPYLTGRQFLQFSADLHGIARKVANKRIHEFAKLYKIEELIDGLFNQFSRGNQQKISIIASLLHEPTLLVIDEPIVGLDVQSQNITQEIISGFVDDGKSVLVCTHTIHWAELMANRIGVLDKGNLVTQGTLKELRKEVGNKNASLEKIYLKLTGSTLS